MKNALCILTLFLLASCFSGKYELLGKKNVYGSSNLYVNFYQKDEFDMVTPLAYELIDENNKILIERDFIIGTNDKLESVEALYATLYDSILYISYPYVENVHIIKDLKNRNQLTRDKLFEIIKSNNKDLKDMQNE